MWGDHPFEIKPKPPNIPKHRAKHFPCLERGTEGDTTSPCSTIAEAPFTLSLPRPAPAESWTKHTALPLQDTPLVQVSREGRGFLPS